MPIPPIAQRLADIQQRISTAALAAKRDPSEITLLAASKNHTLEKIITAFDAGQRLFGESKVQEALPKIQALSDYPLSWHFIGPIQSNKAKTIAQYFSAVHSVDREKIAQKLNDARAPEQPPLAVFLQVNSDNDPAKSGISPDKLLALAEFTARQPRLSLKGLMCLPKLNTSPAAQAESFARARALFQRLQQAHPTVDGLSMGMSHDLEAAITYGATVLRIGRALFADDPEIS